MTTDTVLAEISREFMDFSLGDGAEDEQDEALANYCADGLAFHRYTEDVLTRYVRGSTDIVRIAQAKVLVLDRYLEFRVYASKSHKDKLGDKGHVCLYQVLIQGMHEIRAKQLTLEPPEVLMVPPKPAAVPTESAYALLPPALFLGEVKN